MQKIAIDRIPELFSERLPQSGHYLFPLKKKARSILGSGRKAQR